MINYVRKIDLSLIIKIEILLFFLVCMSGIFHIYFFNSRFDLFFFELFYQPFSDFISVFNYSALENPYDKPYDGPPYLAPSNYPPFAYLILRPLVFFEVKIAFIVYNIILFLLFFYTFFKLKGSLLINKREIMLLAIFIIFSHPFLFAFFRGNLDIVVGILLLNILNYKKNNSFVPGFLIGIAGAIKLVPLAFCIYFIAIKNYRSIFSCFITFLALTLLSINYYDLTLLSFINYFLIEYNEYKNIYVLGEGAMSFFSDPWLPILGFLKFISYPEILFEGYYKFYNVFQIILMTFLTICMLAFRKNLNPLFVMLLIGIMMIGFPAPSSDYKILYLLPGVILYLNNLGKDYSSAVHILGISSTLLFLHFSFFFVVGTVSVSSIIRPMLYTVTIFVITMIFITNLLKRDRILNL